MVEAGVGWLIVWRLMFRICLGFDQALSKISDNSHNSERPVLLVKLGHKASKVEIPSFLWI